MPTQKTKLTMSKAQATGWLFPQTPTPVVRRYPIVRPNRPRRLSEKTNATFQASGVLPSRIEQTVLVTAVKSIPPNTRAARWRGSSEVLSGPVVVRSEVVLRAVDIGYLLWS